MLGFVVIALTAFMIFTLVRNALLGVQISSDESYTGTVELIIPITPRSEFYLEPWLKSLNSFRSLNGRIKIHILIDGHHPAHTAWQELGNKIPYIELHSFPMRPENCAVIPWMIQQVMPQISSQVVIIGDAELVGSEAAFLSLSRVVLDKQIPYFVLPQTAKINIFGESISAINPTLALASVFGFKKYRRAISHPLMSIAQGWIGMPLQTFKDLDLEKVAVQSWKQTIIRFWERKGVRYQLAFGERHLQRHYPTDPKVHIYQLKTYWEELWFKGDRTGLWLFAASLFIWSFPVICFYSYPFWSMATIFLLVIYRFFTKIIFQESWSTIILHPIGCLAWIGTFIWWVSSGLKSRYGTQGRISRN